MRYFCISLLIFTFACFEPARANAAPLPADRSSRAITLAEARTKALQANPGLQALGAEVQALEGNLLQTKAFPNPEIEIAREDFGGGGVLEARAPQDTLALSQLFETGGKRSARSEAAAQEKEAANQNLLAGRLDLTAEVDRRFVTLLGAQIRLRITAESKTTAEKTTAAVAALVQAGEVAPIEELRARSEEALAQVDFEAAQRELFITRRALSQLWGLEEPDFDSAAGALAEEVPIPEEETALARLAALPDLARRRAQTQRLVAQDQLAQRLNWPDLTLSVGQRRYTETGELAYLAALTMPLPLFNRNRGAILEAASRLQQGRLEGRAEEMHLQAALHSAHETLSGSANEVRILHEDVLPKAAQVYDAVQEGYRRGKYGLLDLLQAQRNLSEANLRHLDALIRLNLAKADLERLLGAPIESIEGDRQ